MVYCICQLKTLYYLLMHLLYTYMATGVWGIEKE